MNKIGGDGDNSFTSNTYFAIDHTLIICTMPRLVVVMVQAVKGNGKCVRVFEHEETEEENKNDDLWPEYGSLSWLMNTVGDGGANETEDNLRMLSFLCPDKSKNTLDTDYENNPPSIFMILGVLRSFVKGLKEQRKIR